MAHSPCLLVTCSSGTAGRSAAGTTCDGPTAHRLENAPLDGTATTARRPNANHDGIAPPLQLRRRLPIPSWPPSASPPEGPPSPPTKRPSTPLFSPVCASPTHVCPTSKGRRHASTPCLEVTPIALPRRRPSTTPMDRGRTRERRAGRRSTPKNGPNASRSSWR